MFVIFRSCDEDIELLDAEEFYRIAPESISLPVSNPSFG